MRWWAVYAEWRGDFHCVGVLENGHAFASHICSHPSFAMNDLLGRRPERQAALRAIYGELEFVATIPEDDLPKEVVDRHLRDAWRPNAAAYRAHIEANRPEGAAG